MQVLLLTSYNSRMVSAPKFSIRLLIIVVLIIVVDK